MTVDFPDPRQAPDDVELIAIGAWDAEGFPMEVRGNVPWPKLTEFGTRLTPVVLRTAYRRGIFPMPLDHEDPQSAIGWWSPRYRAYFVTDQIRVTRSLRQSMKKFRITHDQAFRRVVEECGDPHRESAWINQVIIDAYCQLHAEGDAHSIEVWNADGELVGGLYGVEFGSVFAGESMFHHERDASKAALVYLAELLTDATPRIIDTQWLTPHLASLGAKTMNRASYCDLIGRLASGRPRFKEIQRPVPRTHGSY